MEMAQKNVLVVGLAHSGVAAAKLLVELGARVIANDVKGPAGLADALSELPVDQVELVLGGHPAEVFERADAVVVSPGVPKDLAPLADAAAAGKPVISELELAFQNTRAPVAAVTGTNGKSTTVALLDAIMARAHGAERVFAGGNIGTPFCELPLSGREVDAAVVEVSSFQLEFVRSFRPRAAAMLNISADHLDRYRDYDEYADVKFRIFENQTGEDFAVLNADDELVMNKARELSLASRTMTVSLHEKPERGMWVASGAIEYVENGDGREFLKVSEVPLHGRHNLYNVMTAGCLALAMGVDLEVSAEAVRGFEGLAHRLSLVREMGGVRYYNDSKATNAGAVLAAVNGLDGPVVLLMGGQAKGCRFRELGASLSGRVKEVVAFGECAEQLVEDFSGNLPVRKTNDLKSAIEAARGAAENGDIVLLAPGCASFDQFESYKDRGRTFERLVGELG